MFKHRATLPAILAIAALTLGTTATPASTAAVADPSAPATATARPGSVRLFSPDRQVTMTIHRYHDPDGGDWSWTEFDAAAYLEARGQRLEIDVRRPSFRKTIRASVQVGERRRALKRKYLRSWSGLKDAFAITWRTPQGDRIQRTTMTWCPNDSEQSRLSPHAATRTSFTRGCGYHPFTKGHRWGIDRGWARDLLDYVDPPAPGALGKRAVLELAMRPGLARVFGIPADKRTLRFRVSVEEVDESFDDGPIATPASGSDATVRAMASSSRRNAPARPAATGFAPPARSLPDLISLPAFGISTRSVRGRDLLAFGATVYNGGSGPLVAEGFRRGGKPIMDAYQMFYRRNRELGSVKVGTMEYDTRGSHQHWHFEDFAKYDLVDADHRRVRGSGKEAFCLAPTDAIDLLIPGAAVDPGDGDLSTACGDSSSLWVREVLASGWGDTYTQERAGQAINITGLPNGTYWIRVRANPIGRLLELSKKNNVSYRRVVITGKHGARRVRVPAYGRVDSEKRGWFWYRTAR